MTSFAEARNYLLGLLPPGVENFWDLSSTGDFYKLLDAASSLFKTYGFDLLDRLRREQFPSQVVDKLPDWERFLAIARFLTARFGTTTQRQAAVVSKIREKGPFIDTLVESVIAPLLGYFPTTPLEIMRTNKAMLRQQHTYSSSQIIVAAHSTGTIYIPVIDGGVVSRAGVRLLLELGPGGPYTFGLELVSPDLKTKSWGILSNVSDSGIIGLYAKELARAQTRGQWGVVVTNGTGTPIPVIASIFLEGIAQNQRTGGATWEWGVYADPAHVGETGMSDFEAATAAIARIKHSHSIGRIITSKEPWPGVTTGVHAAIPGQCIPSAAT